jgi:uncharacterized iron-regulated membrane protein
LVLRLHFYAGVLVAPFLVVAAVTGLAFVFSPQLDRVVYGDQLQVDRVGGFAHPLAQQVSAARAAHPDGDLAMVIPPVESTDTTKVVFSLPELGEKQHTVYVDPYTNQVKGTLTTWFGETPLMTWLDDLHRNLHLGVVGRHYSELAASWLWVVVLGGLLLWLRRQWTGRRRLRRTLLPDLAAGRGVRRTRSWHAATGVWLAVGLLALSATGLTWSRYAGANFSVLQDSLNAHGPTLDTTLGAASAAGASNTADHHGTGSGTTGPFDVSDVDRVVLVARQAGLTGPVEVTPPSEPGTGWLAAQDDRTWPVHLDQAVIDPDTGTVAARSDFADWPMLAQLSKLGVALHMGFLFGLANQLLLATLAVGLLAMIAWAYRMWWQRRPTRADRRGPLGTPPARGAWRHIHPVVLVTGLAVVAFVGWAVPLLGITLAAFLLIDAVFAMLRRRRTSTPAPARN